MAIPAIISIFDDLNGVQLIDGPLTITNDSTLKISGTADAGTYVDIYRIDSTPGSVTYTKLNSSDVFGVADGLGLGGGVWTFSLPTLNDGPYAFVAVPRGADNVAIATAATTPFDIRIDATAPGQPVITSNSTDTGFVGDNITTDRSQTLTGTGEAGATIRLFNGATEVTPVAGVTVQPNGTWTYTTPNLPLNAVANITAVATDAAGNKSTPSQPLQITIDTAAPAVPTITGFSNDTGTQGDNRTNDNTLTLQGAAEAGSTVNVSDAGAGLVATAVADAAGNWSATTTNPLVDGTYNFTAKAVDGAGNTSVASAPLPTVTIDTVAPAAPSIVLKPSSDSGTKLDGITSDTTPTFTVTIPAAVAGDTVTLFADGVVVGSAVPAAGATTVEVTASTLTEGTKTFTASITDVAGNTGVPSGFVPLTIDTTPLGVPVITGIGDDTGSSATDGITSDLSPTVSGTAAANSTVLLYATNATGVRTLVGQGTADAAGSWTIAADSDRTAAAPGITDFAQGSYSFTAASRDAASNISADSAPFAAILDATAPDQASLNANNTLKIDENNAVGAVVANLTTNETIGVSFELVAGNGTNDADNGKFSISGNQLILNESADFETPTNANADDAYSVRIKATDAAGNARTFERLVTVNDVNEAVSLTLNPASLSYTDTIGKDDFSNKSGTAQGTDLDGDTLAYSIEGDDGAVNANNRVVLEGSYGRLSLNPTTGAFTYIPDDAAINALGNGEVVQDTFQITARDGTLATSFSDTETLTINITGANDAPIVTASTFSVSEGGVTQITNDNFNGIDAFDAEGDDLSYKVSNVTRGKFQTTSNGSAWTDATSFTQEQIEANQVRFVHNGSSASFGAFTLVANDGTVDSEPVAGRINVSPVDDAPALSKFTITVANDGTTSSVLAGNINVVDNDSSAGQISFKVSPIGGQFLVDLGTGNGPQASNTFSLQQVIDGDVSFKDNADGVAPTFQVDAISGSIPGASGFGDPINGTVVYQGIAPNLAPVLAEIGDISIPENALAGTQVADASAIDAEGNPITFQLVGNIPSDGNGQFFAINGTSGVVSVTAAGAAAFDFESPTKSYQLSVQAADATGVSNISQFDVNLTDINENGGGGTPNIVPQELRFDIASDTYTSAQTLDFSYAWARDLNGTADLAEVDFWVIDASKDQNVLSNWTNLSDFSTANGNTFGLWQNNAENGWGDFSDYSLNLAGYAPGNYVLWGQAKDDSGAVSNVWTDTFTVGGNLAPQELQFTIASDTYNAGDSVGFSYAWARDLNGAADLAEVDFWIIDTAKDENVLSNWIDLEDFSVATGDTFGLWENNAGNGWGEFDAYSINTASLGLGAGEYKVWGRATDIGGAVSNEWTDTFTLAAANV